MVIATMSIAKRQWTKSNFWEEKGDCSGQTPDNKKISILINLIFLKKKKQLLREVAKAPQPPYALMDMDKIFVFETR